MDVVSDSKERCLTCVHPELVVGVEADDEADADPLGLEDVDGVLDRCMVASDETWQQRGKRGVAYSFRWRSRARHSPAVTTLVIPAAEEYPMNASFHMDPYASSTYATPIFFHPYFEQNSTAALVVAESGGMAREK